MKLAVLLSGGKDSLLALYRASKIHEISCLVSIFSKNKFSFMFHTPTMNLVELQSEALEIPLIKLESKGNKGSELLTLRRALKIAKSKFGIEGVVSGAINSTYQNTRIQRICDALNLASFNPLWMNDHFKLLNSLIENKFETIVSSVSAYPLQRSFIGKKINRKFLEEIKILNSKYKISPVGEGGEFETLVLDMPIFRKKIVIDNFKVEFKDYSGRIIVKKAHLEKK